MNERLTFHLKVVVVFEYKHCIAFCNYVIKYRLIICNNHLCVIFVSFIQYNYSPCLFNGVNVDECTTSD